MGADTPHTSLRHSVALFKKSGKTVGEAFQFLTWQLLAKHSFNRFHMGKLLSHK